MYIGTLANLSGCTPKAIRLYEQMGLLRLPPRQGAYRVYSAHHLDVVRLIRAAQAVGFKLSQLRELVEAKQAAEGFPVALAQQGIDAKRQEIQAQIAALQAQDLQLLALRGELAQRFGPGAVPACDSSLSVAASTQTPVAAPTAVAGAGNPVR
ncbi:MerR family transcriptional regulator [Pseudomonas sp. MAFF 302046]|jgi:MerR family copper efflux transcriptional regulator|uniref:MerR family transcriptional regulator n=1 Tax=Pseudomonas morbosilactucae TaxID=2938197 RepID=A0ABT0JC35_9PSED|nr:MerR family transcriptional regulator [Pseudomonas morbosilactucae]MCK9813417.1 MerR family transcriptional regulator [Pseudomonas morbosilactucae]